MFSSRFHHMEPQLRLSLQQHGGALSSKNAFITFLKCWMKKKLSRNAEVWHCFVRLSFVVRLLLYSFRFLNPKAKFLQSDSPYTKCPQAATEVHVLVPTAWFCLFIFHSHTLSPNKQQFWLSHNLISLLAVVLNSSLWCCTFLKTL